MTITSVPITKENIRNAIDIYNSDKPFLIHHLNMDSVDSAFMFNEIDEMREHGFGSKLIMDEGKPIGVIDYMIQQSGYVYLSLLMLDSSVQGKGIGTMVYNEFEKRVREQGAAVIRIDVVNDYDSNVIPFWEKVGFVGQGEDELTWGNKLSKVLIMKKLL